MQNDRAKIKMKNKNVKLQIKAQKSLHFGLSFLFFHFYL